jgi:hypothetical protein
MQKTSLLVVLVSFYSSVLPMLKALTLPSYKLEAKMPAELEGVFGIECFGDAEKEIFVTCSQGIIRRWQIGTRKAFEVKLKENTSRIVGETLLNVSGTTFLHCVPEKNLTRFVWGDKSVSVKTHPETSVGSLVKHNGKVVGADYLHVNVWDESLNLLKQIYTGASCNAVVPTYDENIVLVSQPLKKTVLAVNVETYEVEPILFRDSELFDVNCMCMLDKDHVAIGKTHGSVSIYNIRSKQRTVSFDFGDRNILALANVGSDMLAVGTEISDVGIYNWRNGEQVQLIEDEASRCVWSLKALDNNRLAVGTDRFLKVYNLSVQ